MASGIPTNRTGPAAAVMLRRGLFSLPNAYADLPAYTKINDAIIRPSSFRHTAPLPLQAAQ